MTHARLAVVTLHKDQLFKQRHVLLIFKQRTHQWRYGNLVVFTLQGFERNKDDKVAVPPLVGALLKNEQDVTLFEKLVFMQRNNR